MWLPQIKWLYSTRIMNVTKLYSRAKNEVFLMMSQNLDANKNDGGTRQ